MPRWLKVIRGMIRTGLIFAAGVGVVASIVAAVVLLLPGSGGVRELARLVVASTIWSFPIGMAFSGFLAIAARHRSFDELSIPRFAALGSGAGLLFFGLLATNAWQAWSVSTAIANATIFVLLGGGAATATLAIARKARPELEPGDEWPSLEEG